MIHFFSDDKVGMVQARWGHVNRDYSRLTEVEAIMLDGHFVIEHTARHRSGRFFNFNGTAGMWRIKAIQDAGGWQHDTLTEDMDLSYRAQLKGWEFIYLPDIVSPAELPVEMNSFKSQQFRWAKGSIQVAKKLLPTILRSNIPWRVKFEAFFHLTNNFAYPLLLLLSILLLPNLLVRTHHGWREVLILDLPLFFGTTLSVVSFYIVAAREVRPRGWGEVFRYLPLMLSVGIGLCINQTRAVFEALAGKETEFVRTPKHGVETKTSLWAGKRYHAMKTLIPYFELFMAAYFGAAMLVAYQGSHFLSMPFLLLFLVGFLYVGALSAFQRR
jgi:cellulose synthase/poly-beta-1,6-N-acetylglucosamine synthase-like glycosyltransferase